MGFELSAPGVPLHARRVDIGLVGVLRQEVTAWQLLYRTTGPREEPEVTTTTVLVPAAHDPAHPRLLGYQCAINSSARRCFPSYSLLQGSRVMMANPQAELLLIAAALRRGWIVSAADHGGQSGRYVTARQPGYHALDGLRAVLAFNEFRLPADTPVGLWGYSGGGLASAWTAELAPSYAPELNIVGAALGSPAPDPANILGRANGGMFAGLAVAAVAALRGGYPELDSVLQQHLSPKGHKMLDSVLDMSTAQAAVRYVRVDLGRHADLALTELMALPDVAAMSEDLRLGKSVPRCPVFVYSAVHDQLVGIAEVDRQTDFYRDGGTQVTYRRDRLSEHVALVVLGAPAALDWLAQRFGDVTATTHPGARTVWSLLASRSALRALSAMAAAIARMLARRPL